MESFRPKKTARARYFVLDNVNFELETQSGWENGRAGNYWRIYRCGQPSVTIAEGFATGSTDRARHNAASYLQGI